MGKGKGGFKKNLFNWGRGGWGRVKSGAGYKIFFLTFFLKVGKGVRGIKF